MRSSDSFHDIGEYYPLLVEAGIRYVSFRPRSEKEIREHLVKKLQKHQISDSTLLDRVITRLRELDYVNDEKFAAWWVDQRQSHKPKGTRLLTRELNAKGVSVEIKQSDEVGLAGTALSKKLALWGKLPKLEQKKKIYGFLGRRGFTSDTIHRVIDELVSGNVQL